MSLIDKYQNLLAQVLKEMEVGYIGDTKQRLDWLKERLNECIEFGNISEKHYSYLEEYLNDTF